jgi:hypothetical protein
MSIRVYIAEESLKELGKDLENLSAATQEKVKASLQILAAQVHGYVIQEVNATMKSTRSVYIKSIVGPTEVGENMWMVGLKKDAEWIEQGYPAYDMIPKLTSGPKSKVSKDGCVLNPRNKILTIRGWVKIKDIKVGDFVLTHSGKFREVKEVKIQKAGINTEYITIYPKTIDSSRPVTKKYNDLTCPSLSLTLDHLVLTPLGWIPAEKLKKGDLIATPGDLKKLCKKCGSPVPINVLDYSFCLNNRCNRSYLAQERDKYKEKACVRDGIKLLRISSHKIYKIGSNISRHLSLWIKNHSGELGVAWVKISKIKKGKVNRPAHVFAKKYDLCLDAEEHSFCCETVYIHNSRYTVIPFKHNKRPSDMSRAEMNLANYAKAELKARGLDKVIKDSQGRALSGKVATVNLTGPGAPMSRHNTPLLAGLTVYQTIMKNQQTGKETVRRDVMTFRTVSEKQKGTGKWYNKGMAGFRIFDKVQGQVDAAWGKMVAELLNE